MIRKILFGAFALLAAGTLYFFISESRPVSAVGDTHTCAQDGKFASLPSGSLNVSDTQRSALALQWLKAQQQPSTHIAGDGSIALSQVYGKSYTGPVSGTFTIGNDDANIVSDASIEITGHSSLPDTFRGSVSGKVLTTPTAWRWIIQVYKENNGVYTQVPKQALADAVTGEFTIDLSDVTNPPAGSWAFGILDAENSYAPYGEKWPATPYYENLEVQLKLVTDGVYDWTSVPALASNSFTFDNSNTGTKLVRLVNTQTNEILAQYVPLTGLVRSYQIDADDPPLWVPEVSCISKSPSTADLAKASSSPESAANKATAWSYTNVSSPNALP